jgi:TM2 domain-containing membrane protein YozV
MAKAINLLPEIKGDELFYIQSILDTFSEEEAERFAHIYRSRRKNPQDILIFAIIGLLIVPGLQRFLLNQIGMGILYFFTIGLCFIGSILDLVNYERLTFEYNQRVADELKMAISYELKQSGGSRI